jgi:hypothetical protein
MLALAVDHHGRSEDLLRTLLPALRQAGPWLPVPFDPPWSLN